MRVALSQTQNTIHRRSVECPRRNKPCGRWSAATQNLDAIWDSEWERHWLNLALVRVKRQVNPAHYAIYHLLVREERPTAEVRRALGVNAAQVYLAKHRVGAAVKKELRSLTKEEM